MSNTITNTAHLVKKIQISGIIRTLSGLHIGASNMGLSIGGADATVVRNPLTNEPYIPGSSLKGKMRSLLEKLENKFGPPLGRDIQNGPYLDPYDPSTLITVLFGTMPEHMKNGAVPPGRTIIRDASLSRKSAKELSESKHTDMPYTEVKTEVVIDRVSSAATPRQMERVPAGAEFELRIILNIYQGDDELALLNRVLLSLSLLQNDYLGGKGTRGSGEVKISIQQIGYKSLKEYAQNQTWQNYISPGFAIPQELQ